MFNNLYDSLIHVVPEPTVSLHSNSLNPTLSESALILICTVELNPAVDVPVTVNVVWNGPDGTAIAPTAPEMKTFTLYVASSTIHSTELADSGNYSCAVGIENGVTVSTNTSIKIGMIRSW